MSTPTAIETEIFAPSAPTEPIREVQPSDWEQMFYESQKRVEELENVVKAANIKPVSDHPAKDARPGITDAKLRAELGPIEYGKLSRADKATALGIKPADVPSEEFLRKVFGRGNTGIEAKELMNSNPLRYRTLKQLAISWNIYSN